MIGGPATVCTGQEACATESQPGGRQAMKRVGNLFDAILGRDNLRLALHRALRGKRHGPEARAFASLADGNLSAMAAGLRDGTFPVGRFHQRRQELPVGPPQQERADGPERQPGLPGRRSSTMRQ